MNAVEIVQLLPFPQAANKHWNVSKHSPQQPSVA